VLREKNSELKILYTEKNTLQGPQGNNLQTQGEIKERSLSARREEET
jgi:hypothetical protein